MVMAARQPGAGGAAKRRRFYSPGAAFG